MEARDMQGAQWDELLKKIDALQAMAAPDSGATQHEIEAATGRMQALLTRHALTMEMVEPHLGSVDKTALGAWRIDTSSASWRGALLNVVAKNNFGRSVYLGKGVCEVISDRNGHRIIKDLYLFLSEVIEKLALIEWDKFQRSEAFSHRYSKRTWLSSFRSGAVAGVNEAMIAARSTAVESFDGGSALVLVKDAKLDAKLRELYPRLGQRSSSVGYGNAYGSGKAAGRGIPMGGQVGGGGNTRAIG